MGKEFTVLEAKERLELAKIFVDEINEDINDQVDRLKESFQSALNCAYYEIEDEEAGRNEGINAFEELFISAIEQGGLHKITLIYCIEIFRDILKGKVDERTKKNLLYRMNRKNKKDE